MSKQIKVLLVDDEPDFIQPMAFWLKNKGYETVVAYSGEKGIEFLKTEDPDIVFLDLNMPGMDGIKTLKKMKKINKEIPAIIISAYLDNKRINKFEKYGASGVFFKGDDFAKGLVLLEAVLKRHKKLQK